MTHRRLRGGELALFLACILAAGFVAFALLSPGNGGHQTGAAPFKPAAAVASARHRYQELAALTSAHEVFAAPTSRPFRRISATRPITGERTVLPVLHTAARGLGEWLQVQLPGRPNGLTGWIKSSSTRLEYTQWRILVNTGRRRVYAYHDGQVVRSFRAVVGAPATPTPKGHFFVEENVALAPSAVGYPYALALSARSKVFQEFDGGPGQIAFHGLGNVGGTLGTAASNGCIRLNASAITWLASRISPGVPVAID